MTHVQTAADFDHARAVAEAGEMVSAHLRICREITDRYLEFAWDREEKKTHGMVLDRALDLVRLCADLAGTLARLRGEVRQRIVVEHIEAPAAPALIGETRTVEMAVDLGGRGEGADSGKQLDAVPRHDEPTS